MDLVTMRSALRTRVGVPASDALYTDAVCTALINAALHHIESEADWGWLEAEETVATINGTATYSLPTRYRSSIGVYSPDGFPLEKATAESHRLLRGASGTPKVWDVFGSSLRLAPVPTGAANLTHAYIGGEADLAADGDTPSLPAVWHNAVVEYAAYLGFRRWSAQADAGSALAAYEEWLDQMLKKAPRHSVDTGGGEEPPVAEPKAS